MKLKCPECSAQHSMIRKYGRFYRKSDSKWISRYQCKRCSKHFSSASFSPCYQQNKRRLNHLVHKDLASNVSQRRIAKKFGISRVTVKRKQTFLAQQARLNHAQWLCENKGSFVNIQFDDLETFEHSKCKPLSATVVVEKGTRKILGFSVAQIPAKGHLAKISRKKYGLRPDFSRKKRRELFNYLKEYINPYAEFETDQHTDYEQVLKQHFPLAAHKTYKSKKSSIRGQGELKKTKHDPIFSINHTLAMLRANVNRLIRQTWCTTKKASALEDHLWVYVDYHNQVLT